MKHLLNINDYITENKKLNQLDLNEILHGYIECALFTEEERLELDLNNDDDDDDDDDMDEIEKIIKLHNNYKNKPFNSFISDDIDIDSKIDAYNDIKKFIEYAGDDAVTEAIEKNGLFNLGMDIWFARNSHGAGFFDHSYNNEDALMDAGQKLKEVNLVVGLKQFV